jgi:hypothetical protein
VPLPPVAVHTPHSSASAPAPAVRISIGRIHVVASSRAARREGPAPGPTSRQQHTMSLEEYLQHRAAGRAG